MEIRQAYHLVNKLFLLLVYLLQEVNMNPIQAESRLLSEILTLRQPRQATSGNTDNTPINENLPLAKLNISLNLQSLTTENVTLLFRSIHQYQNRQRREILLTTISLSEANSRQCCPTIAKKVERKYGQSREGKLVKLFHNDNVVQNIYEVSCNDTILNKPCQFIDPALRNSSRCQQLTSYTYAVVKDAVLPGAEDSQDNYWRVDFILYDSGCSCWMDETE